MECLFSLDKDSQIDARWKESGTEMFYFNVKRYMLFRTGSERYLSPVSLGTFRFVSFLPNGKTYKECER